MKPFPTAQPLPPEIEERLQQIAGELTQQIRARGDIPDDWRIDIDIGPVTAQDVSDNMVRIIATPRPPYDRVTGEGMG